MVRKIRKTISIAILAAFITTSVKIPAYAQLADDRIPRLPAPGVMVHLSPEFTPAHLQGITIHPDNALQFDFLIHKGDKILEADQKKEEYKKLVKYFLASLTIPDEDQWVNLSPYEKDRIIKDDFGKTEMGRDLLTEDYILKQITSSLIYPEDGLGKKFWNKIYERAWNEYHTTNIPVNTFNKVWIVPDQAIVYESGNTAYILQSHLKVMLEEDYLSLQKHFAIPSSSTVIPAKAEIQNKNDINALGSQIIKEIILPELEKEVNRAKNFANLRQMYSGMILATWYKKALKQSLLGKVYTDKAKIAGLVIPAKASMDVNVIYQRYLKAFKKGVFNYIKEDVDKYTNEAIPRKYFSAGFQDFAQVTEVGPETDFKETRVLIIADRATISFIPEADRHFDIAPVGSLDRATIALTPEEKKEDRKNVSPEEQALTDLQSTANDVIKLINESSINGDLKQLENYAKELAGAKTKEQKEDALSKLDRLYAKFEVIRKAVDDADQKINSKHKRILESTGELIDDDGKTSPKRVRLFYDYSDKIRKIMGLIGSIKADWVPLEKKVEFVGIVLERFEAYSQMLQDATEPSLMDRTDLTRILKDKDGKILNRESLGLPDSVYKFLLRATANPAMMALDSEGVTQAREGAELAVKYLTDHQDHFVNSELVVIVTLASIKAKGDDKKFTEQFEEGLNNL